MIVETKPKVSGRSAERECPECGKIVHGGGGLYGHLLMAHGIRQPRRETRLALEVQQLKADLVRRDTKIANLNNEVARLKQECEKTSRVWDECPACGEPYATHKQAKLHATKMDYADGTTEIPFDREMLVCPDVYQSLTRRAGLKKS